MNKKISLLVFALILLTFSTCNREPSCHEEMLTLLRKIKTDVTVPENFFSPEGKLPYMDSLLQLPHSTPNQIAYCKYLKANIMLELGKEQEAVAIFESLRINANATQFQMIL